MTSTTQIDPTIEIRYAVDGKGGRVIDTTLPSHLCQALAVIWRSREIDAGAMSAGIGMSHIRTHHGWTPVRHVQFDPLSSRPYDIRRQAYSDRNYLTLAAVDFIAYEVVGQAQFRRATTFNKFSDRLRSVWRVVDTWGCDFGGRFDFDKLSTQYGLANTQLWMATNERWQPPSRGASNG